MTDRNYNGIDIFDIKCIKTCEQVREEKLKGKAGGLSLGRKSITEVKYEQEGENNGRRIQKPCLYRSPCLC